MDKEENATKHSTPATPAKKAVPTTQFEDAEGDDGDIGAGDVEGEHEEDPEPIHKKNSKRKQVEVEYPFLYPAIIYILVDVKSEDLAFGPGDYYDYSQHIKEPGRGVFVTADYDYMEKVLNTLDMVIPFFILHYFCGANFFL